MIVGRKPIGTIAAMFGTPAVLTEFCRSWGRLIAYTQQYICVGNEYVHLDDAPISFHSWARNGLVDNMLGDWLLMLDTDHSFEPDLLGRMLHRMGEYDLDVLCGVYQFKQPPHPPVLYGWYAAGDGSPEAMVPLAGWGGVAEVMEVGGAGAGCLLVKRRVFDRIHKELGERPFDVIGQGGEDLAFFRRLRRLGVKAHVDVRIECHHLVQRPLTMEDYDPEAVGYRKVRLPDAAGYAADEQRSATEG